MKLQLFVYTSCGGKCICFDCKFQVRVEARNFTKSGLPDFNLLHEIFHDSGATGIFASSSMQLPPSDEEEAVLQRQFDNVQHRVPFQNIDDNDEDIGYMDLSQCGGAKTTSSGSKRKHNSSSVGPKGKESASKAQKTNCEIVKAAMYKQLTEESAMRTKEVQLRTEKTVKEIEEINDRLENASSYSIPMCTAILNEEFPNLSSESKWIFAESFKGDAEWRQLWVSVTAADRKWRVENFFKK